MKTVSELIDAGLEAKRAEARRLKQKVSQELLDDQLIARSKKQPGDSIKYGNCYYQVYQLFTNNNKLYYMIRNYNDEYFQETEDSLINNLFPTRHIEYTGV